MTKYRIVITEHGHYEVQYKGWWFWNSIRCQRFGRPGWAIYTSKVEAEEAIKNFIARQRVAGDVVGEYEG